MSVYDEVANALWQDGTMHCDGPETLAKIAVDTANPILRNAIARELEDLLDGQVRGHTLDYRLGFNAACEIVFRALRT